MEPTHEITVLQGPHRIGPDLAHDSASASPMSAILRRWPTLAIITFACAVSTSLAVWFLVSPKFEISATLHVSPRVRAILVSDPDTDVTHDYRQYVGTEAANIVSSVVLGAALNQPELRSLPLVAAAPDPVALLQKAMVVEPMRGTELLKVAMIGSQAEPLVAIVNAVVDAYMARQESQQKQWDERVLSSLKAEQAGLEARLRVKERQLRESAVEQGLGGAEDSGLLIDRWLIELRQLLTQARKDQGLADAQLAALGDAAADILDSAAFDDYLNRDPELQKLREQLRSTELSALSDAGLVLGPGHPDVLGRPALIASLQQRIDERWKRLGELFASSQRRDLAAGARAAEVAVNVYQKEIDHLIQQRDGVKTQQLVLDDLRHERAEVEKSLSMVREKIWNVEVEQNRAARISIASSARVPPSPNVDKRLKYLAVALVMSLCAGVGAALLRSHLDTRFYDPLDVTERIGVRVLGSIQRLPEAKMPLDGIDPRVLEPIRGISTALLTAAPTTAHSRMITSPTPASGKSSLALNLARSVAATGRRVLLVDADNHGQGATRRLRLTDHLGLSELIGNGVALGEVLVASGVPNLTVLPAGKRTDDFGTRLTDLDAQRKLRALFAEYDEVIVDSPPVLARSDAVVLATLVDEVVLVLRAGLSTTHETIAAQHHLATVGAKVVGAILNAVEPRNVRYGYDYTYAGAYASQKDD